MEQVGHPVHRNVPQYSLVGCPGNEKGMAVIGLAQPQLIRDVCLGICGSLSRDIGKPPQLPHDFGDPGYVTLFCFADFDFHIFFFRVSIRKS